MNDFATEVDLAKVVIAWLEDHHWDVYQEVDSIDIVAVHGPILWAIECKLGNNLKVIEQAMDRLAVAHYVSIATPKYATRGLGKILGAFGIGHLLVKPDYGAHPSVREDWKPVLHRTAERVRKLRQSLTPEHKTWGVAGSPTGASWTPFKETCREVVREVRDRPGIALGELIASIKHHYRTPASARGSIRRWIESGYIAGVRIEQDGRAVKVWPVEISTAVDIVEGV